MGYSPRARALQSKVSFVALVGILMALALPQTTGAAALSAARDRLNRQVASQTTGISHTVAFTTSAVNGTENKVVLRFADADDGLWCRTAGTDVTVGTSTEDSASALPGTLTAACTQGAGASSYDTITVSGVSDLSTATRYGFVVSDGSTAKLGTPGAAASGVITVETQTSGGAAIDSQNIAVDIIANDQVAVSATVDPSISVVLSGNTAALGTLSTSNVNQAGITSQVTTNALNGYTSSALYNNTLRIDGSNDIDDTAGGTIVAGTEEFGASSSDSGNTIGIWSPTSCATTTSTSNATALTTSAQTFASASAPVNAETTTLCLLASISGTTAAGSYSNTVTLVTTAKY
jgi:hypothetical protein